MIIMRCIDGDLGVLAGHAPVSTVLGDGIYVSLIMVWKRNWLFSAALPK